MGSFWDYSNSFGMIRFFGTEGTEEVLKPAYASKCLNLEFHQILGGYELSEKEIRSEILVLIDETFAIYLQENME